VPLWKVRQDPLGENSPHEVDPERIEQAYDGFASVGNNVIEIVDCQLESRKRREMQRAHKPFDPHELFAQHVAPRHIRVVIDTSLEMLLQSIE